MLLSLLKNIDNTEVTESFSDLRSVIRGMFFVQLSLQGFGTWLPLPSMATSMMLLLLMLMMIAE